MYWRKPIALSTGSYWIVIYPKDTERYPPFEQLEPEPDPQNNQIPGETIPLEINLPTANLFTYHPTHYFS